MILIDIMLLEVEEVSTSIEFEFFDDFYRAKTRGNFHYGKSKN